MFEDLPENEANNLNIISLIVLLIIVLTICVFIYCSVTKSTKNLNVITNVLAMLYLGFVIAGSILYAVYTRDTNDTDGLFYAAAKGIFLIVGGILITALIIYIKNHIIKNASVSSTGSKYFVTDSTTTIVGNTTSSINLTKTD